jgi:hypothetical protein
MESKTVSIEELEIGNCLYYFDLIVYYDEDYDAGSDYAPSSSEIEIIDVDFASDVTAFNCVSELEYQVTDKDELKLVMSYIDPYHELIKSL